MINELNMWYVVEDNSLYQDIFTSVIESLDDFIHLTMFNFADEAEKTYIQNITKNKPHVMLVDLDLKGSTFDGLELIRRVNFKHGNDIIIGVISTSEDEVEMAKAKKFGAMFWMKKSGELDIILPAFIGDLLNYHNRKIHWKVYGNKED